MQRIALSLAALGVLALSLTGCCCHGCGGGYGAGYAPACPAPCNPCAPTYGAALGGAPIVSAPGCPNGNCGMYPSGAFYGPAPIAAAIPGVYATAALPIDAMPTY